MSASPDRDIHQNQAAAATAPRWLRVLRAPPVRAVLGFFAVAAGMALGDALGRVGGGQAVQQLGLAVGGLLAYVAFVRAVERRPVRELALRPALPHLAAGFALGAALFAAVVGVLALAGSYRVVGANPPAAMLPVLATMGTAAVVEELLMRAVLFRIAEAWIGSGWALLLSALVFGAAHAGNPNADWFTCAAIALEAGVLLGAAWMVTRSAWFAIGIHAAWNFTQTGVFGLATSGVDGAGWLRGATSGPAWLSGGAFGPEASVVAVALCTGCGAVLLALAVRRGHWVPARRRAGEGTA